MDSFELGKSPDSSNDGGMVVLQKKVVQLH